MKKTIISIALALVFVALAATGCAGPSSSTTKGPITVGSKIDVEGSLLGEMIILALRDHGFTVIDKTQFGTTPIVKAALENGELDMYPEYTGNGAFFFNEQSSPVWKNAKEGYDRVKQLDEQKNHITWLAPAPANNTWAIAIPKALSESQGIKSLSDFAAYVNRGGRVKLIGSEEFVTSQAALPAFEKAYGFNLTQDQLLTVSSGDTTQTEKAASEGTNGVNAAMAYGTDGAIGAFNLVVLSDPLNVQPVYEPAPRVRMSVMQKYPEIATILNPIFESLTLETLQNLNAKIGVDGQPATDVARAYLISKNFIKK